MTAAANLIFLIHLAIVLFVVLAPFLGRQETILMNFVFMFGILLHWAGSDSTCCLTVLEQYLRGETDPSRTFFGRIMIPVYSFGNEKLVTQAGLMFLMLFSLYRLDTSTLSRIKSTLLRLTS